MTKAELINLFHAGSVVFRDQWSARSRGRKAGESRPLNAAAKLIAARLGVTLGARENLSTALVYVKVRWPLGAAGEIVLTIEDGYTCAGDAWAADVRVVSQGRSTCVTLVRPMSTRGAEVKREGRTEFCRFAQRFMPTMLHN